MDEGAIILIVGVGIFGGAVFGVNAYAAYQCSNYEQTTGRPTKYLAFDACYIERDGKWYRWDEYKLAFATQASGD